MVCVVVFDHLRGFPCLRLNWCIDYGFAIVILIMICIHMSLHGDLIMILLGFALICKDMHSDL